jgi:hypothetical protein
MGIPNSSSYTLQSVCDIASANGDTAPALATGGFSDQPAIQIANSVLSAMLLGGPNGPFNPKWNRFTVTPFPTISWQQDYFIPGLVTLGWLESCYAIQFANTSQPKPKCQIEVHKDLMVGYTQGWPGKICWIPPSTAQTGTWGATELQTPTGQNNPGPNVVYTNPLTAVNQPANPITNITDPNGNLWTVTTYGTCGATQPSWTVDPVFPTLTSPNTVASTVTDGTTVWTAINPNGQAMRISPIPPQQGCVWQINPIGQQRIVQFTALTQSLGVIPDDYYQYFCDGFLAQCYRRNPDPKVRARFPDEWKIWLASWDLAVRQGQREMDDFAFVPSEGIMQDNGFAAGWYGPAYPFAGSPGWY